MAPCNMNLTGTRFWIATTALLASLGECAGAGVGRRFTPSESILDFVDTAQVERLLAARRADRPPGYLQWNELDEGGGDSRASPTPPALDRQPSTELPKIDFRKALKSSKNALIVTKKEYLKEDWCKTETFVQKIREPGCLSVKVLNNFCYGQCNSFYIPKAPRRRDSAGGEERPPPAFSSCSFCRPKKVSWMDVTLRCPGQQPPFRRRRLQKVKECKCLPAGVN